MTYRIKGKRYLKKYTAEALSPVYAASVDAAAVARGLCGVPWIPSEAKVAQMSYHTSEVVDKETGATGLDCNVAIREKFDAALFCAEHKAGMHRAYANAACYVFELPDVAEYPNLTKVKLRVTSDPYNSSGVRLAVHVSDTVNIPVSCAVAREGVARVEGAVPREERLGADGKTYWYAATDTVEISVPDVKMKKYLFVVVGLENYAISRGDWLEGSAFISPTVEIETDGEITGWSGGGVNDVESRVFELTRFSSWEAKCESDYKDSGGRVNVDGSMLGMATDWYSPEVMFAEADKGRDKVKFSPMVQARVEAGAFLSSVNLLGGGGDAARKINSCYAGFFAGKMRRAAYPDFTTMTFGGASFAVGCDGRSRTPEAFSIHRRKILNSFVLPHPVRRAQISWTAVEGAYVNSPMRFNFWLKRGERCHDYSLPELQDCRLWTADVQWVKGWELVCTHMGTANGKYSVECDLDIPDRGPHTFMYTCYIPPEAFFPGGEVLGGECRLGAGWDNVTLEAAESSVFLFGGAFAGGWLPEIKLIG